MGWGHSCLDVLLVRVLNLCVCKKNAIRVLENDSSPLLGVFCHLVPFTSITGHYIDQSKRSTHLIHSKLQSFSANMCGCRCLFLSVTNIIQFHCMFWKDVFTTF